MNPFGALRGLGRAVVSLVVILLAMAFVAGHAFAATTFTPSVTAANGELTTTLTWQSTQAQCVASGSPNWTGTKPTTGTLALPKITLSGTYTLTLACSTPASLTASLSWVNPTQNTDGTAYTDHAGVRVVYGRAADTLAQVVQVANPSATSYKLEGLAVGKWFFAVKAYNAQGVESVISNVTSKTIAAGTSETETVKLTVNPIPGNPTGLTVE